MYFILLQGYVWMYCSVKILDLNYQSSIVISSQVLGLPGVQWTCSQFDLLWMMFLRFECLQWSVSAECGYEHLHFINKSTLSGGRSIPWPKLRMGRWWLLMPNSTLMTMLHFAKRISLQCGTQLKRILVRYVCMDHSRRMIAIIWMLWILYYIKHLNLEHKPSYSLQVVLGVPTWYVCCLAFQDEQGSGYLIFRWCFHFYFWLLTSGMYYPGGSC